MRQIVKFLSEVRAEFKNITWPSRQSLIQLTFVVISISIIISLILGGFDYIFTQSIALLGQNKQTVAPTVISTATPTPDKFPPILPTTKPTIKK
ncbi:preprotein translocase subunit SecE [Candidatus Shapirobacteria bacterium]|nr:preprotein translocase subunit SecE [Candidatus Shapirobacteria bacterium]